MNWNRRGLSAALRARGHSASSSPTASYFHSLASGGLVCSASFSNGLTCGSCGDRRRATGQTVCSLNNRRWFLTIGIQQMLYVVMCNWADLLKKTTLKWGHGLNRLFQVVLSVVSEINLLFCLYSFCWAPHCQFRDLFVGRLVQSCLTTFDHPWFFGASLIAVRGVSVLKLGLWVVLQSWHGLYRTVALLLCDKCGIKSCSSWLRRLLCSLHRKKQD